MQYVFLHQFRGRNFIGRVGNATEPSSTISLDPYCLKKHVMENPITFATVVGASFTVLLHQSLLGKSYIRLSQIHSF